MLRQLSSHAQQGRDHLAVCELVVYNSCSVANNATRVYNLRRVNVVYNVTSSIDHTICLAPVLIAQLQATNRLIVARRWCRCPILIPCRRST